MYPRLEISHVPRRILFFSDEDCFATTLQSIISGEYNCEVVIDYEIENYKASIWKFLPHLLLINSCTRMELVHRIKLVKQFRNIPVIFFSGAVSSDDFKVIKPDGYFCKPLNLDSFLHFAKPYLPAPLANYVIS